jgi:hypothetical protein
MSGKDEFNALYSVIANVPEKSRILMASATSVEKNVDMNHLISLIVPCVNFRSIRNPEQTLERRFKLPIQEHENLSWDLSGGSKMEEVD